MTEALPSIEPVVPASPSYQTLDCTDCSGAFRYFLYSDWTTWQTWEYSVLDPATYAVTDRQATNQAKFSAFILGIECTTVDDGDSCCFKSNSNGALCISAASGGTAANTYRINENDWATMIAGFSGTQASYTSSSEFTGSLAVTNDETLSIEYFDYASCASSGNVHTCKMWQPDWGLDDTGAPYTEDGYPRFGIDETGISAGFINVDSSSELAMLDVTLAGATTLVAAGCSALLLSMF